MAVRFLLLLNVLAVAVVSSSGAAAKCQSPWKDCGSTDMKVSIGCSSIPIVLELHIKHKLLI